MSDTIFALSSGSPPAGIAVIRISGPGARSALEQLAGRVPLPRQASLALLTEPDTGEPLDRALVLWLPGPASVTGEDMVELHCHGGRAVVTAVEDALATLPAMRRAEAGEFTRRAFENGHLDLNAVEGLSDLLASETQSQRRAALLMTEGHFSRKVAGWGDAVLNLSALAEAALDFSDEDDVPGESIEDDIRSGIEDVLNDVTATLAMPSAERLRDGIRVVLAGPPNAGKSTLLNALVGRDAAIVSEIAGTTRDRIEVPAAINGAVYLFTDTAGLRNETNDVIEAVGIDRARAAVDAADIVLWLGDRNDLPREDAVLIAAQADRHINAQRPGLSVSAVTGAGVAELMAILTERACSLLPGEGEVALHARQKEGVRLVAHHLVTATRSADLMVIAEELRLCRRAIDTLSGRAGTEDMLDRLFSGFCIGK